MTGRKTKKTQRARLPLRTLYGLMKWQMEEDLATLKKHTPWQHAGVRAQQLLDRSPLYWRIYQAAMAAGEPAEFQQPGKMRTERDEKWEPLEQAARTLVARSDRPLTLRNAVVAVVRTPEGEAMYRAYLKARDR